MDANELLDRTDGPTGISMQFIRRMLTPYRRHAQYLLHAQITSITPTPISKGTFSIPESCYIDATGHFNAVEFNICYNQLAYVSIGKLLMDGALCAAFPNWNRRVRLDFDTYLQRQLSSMLIVKMESRFLKPMNSQLFWGGISARTHLID